MNPRHGNCKARKGCVSNLQRTMQSQGDKRKTGLLLRLNRFGNQRKNAIWHRVNCKSGSKIEPPSRVGPRKESHLPSRGIAKWHDSIHGSEEDSTKLIASSPPNLKNQGGPKKPIQARPSRPTRTTTQPSCAANESMCVFKPRQLQGKERAYK